MLIFCSFHCKSFFSKIKTLIASYQKLRVQGKDAIKCIFERLTKSNVARCFFIHLSMLCIYLLKSYLFMKWKYHWTTNNSIYYLRLIYNYGCSKENFDPKLFYFQTPLFGSGIGRGTCLVVVALGLVGLHEPGTISLEFQLLNNRNRMINLLFPQSWNEEHQIFTNPIFLSDLFFINSVFHKTQMIAS